MSTGLTWPCSFIGHRWIPQDVLCADICARCGKMVVHLPPATPRPLTMRPPPPTAYDLVHDGHGLTVAVERESAEWPRARRELEAVAAEVVPQLELHGEDEKP